MTATRINPDLSRESQSQGGGILLESYGKVRVVTLTESSLAVGWSTLCTLPSQHKPQYIVKAPLVATGGNGYAGILSIENGEVKAYNGSGSARAFAGQAIYTLP